MPNSIRSTLKDGGPVYTETSPEQSIVEPFNAASALLFIFIALYWLLKLRGHYRQYIFFTYCMIWLMIGGIGGFLYHAFRSSSYFLVMDFLPIFIITLSVSLFFWHRILKRWWMVCLVIFPFFVLHRLIFEYLPIHLSINMGYGLIAVLVITPIFIFLWRNQFKFGHYFFSSVVLFGVGLACRAYDPYSATQLSIGTHWLWHVFSAASVASLCKYMYLVFSREIESIE